MCNEIYTNESMHKMHEKKTEPEEKTRAKQLRMKQIARNTKKTQAHTFDASKRECKCRMQFAASRAMKPSGTLKFTLGEMERNKIIKANDCENSMETR